MSLDVYEDIERCMSGGWSDGLPVIPPYGSLVDKMLAAMGWDYTEVVGSLPEQSIKVHASHVAAAAVMAGCKFEYGPVLRALTLALLDPAFNVTGVEVTTAGASATVIVSGPAVERYGFAREANCLGANNRANATVGRFAQMVRYFCGRGGGAAGYLIVIGPEHMDLIAKRYSRDEARQFLYTRAVRPTDELLRIGRLPKAPRRGSKVVPGADRPPVASPEHLHFVESGGNGGKFSAVIPQWVGSRAYVCRPVADQPAPTTDQP